MNDSFIKAYQDQIEAAKKAFAPTGIPSMEVSPAIRDAALKGLAACRENYEKLKSSADQMNAAMEDTYAAASKGVTQYNTKVLDTIQTNMNTAFDFFNTLLHARTVAEATELSTSHMRKQFEAFSAQAKELSSLAQQVAAESSEPLKTGMEKLERKAAE